VLLSVLAVELRKTGDARPALQRWRELEPDNAASQLYAMLETRGDAGDTEAREMLRGAARATRYASHAWRSWTGIAYRILLNPRVDTPREEAAHIATGAAGLFILPSFIRRLEVCRVWASESVEGIDVCDRVGDLMSDGDTELERLLGNGVRRTMAERRGNNAAVERLKRQREIRSARLSAIGTLTSRWLSDGNDAAFDRWFEDMLELGEGRANDRLLEREKITDDIALKLVARDNGTRSRCATLRSLKDRPVLPPRDQAYRNDQRG